jgi:hypothetical protein
MSLGPAVSVALNGEFSSLEGSLSSNPETGSLCRPKWIPPRVIPPDLVGP